MARPSKQGLDYFPHDTDASGDDKIEALMLVHGLEGYAVYFLILERIYRRQDLQLDISASEMGEETRQILCKKFGISEDKLMSIIKTAVRWNLFDKQLFEQQGMLTSDAIKRRAAEILDKRASARLKYQESKKVSDAETTQETPQEITQETTQENGSEMPERKEKKNKENKKRSALSQSLFEQIWLLYPIHKEKQNALKAWQELKCDELFEKIKDALIRQKAEQAEASAAGVFYPEFPYLAKWIKRRRWDDEPKNDSRASPKTDNLMDITEDLKALRLMKERRRQLEAERKQTKPG